MSNNPQIISYGYILNRIQQFAKQEEIKDLSKVLIVFDRKGIWLKAFCGKSFNEAMKNGAFCFDD